MKVYPSYEIYKKQGDKLEKLEDYCYEASDKDMYLASEMLLNDEITSFLYFAIGKDDLEKGEYLIKYGEENKGDVYSEMSFMVD